MDIETASKMMAEECGIRTEINANEGCFYWTTDVEPVELFNGLFTIKDARCREIVREKFHIFTEPYDDQVICITNYGQYKAYGKTIPESEIACILAICESMEKGNEN